MKNNILERLLKEDHISISGADDILNGSQYKVEIINDLLKNRQISNKEALILLNNHNSIELIQQIPQQFPQYQPYISYNPNYGAPWTVTCSSDLNKNFTEK